MAPSRAGDNSSVKVSEDVLRRGGLAAGPMTLEGGVPEVGQQKRPCHHRGGCSSHPCRACVAIGAATAFCLSAAWLGFSIGTHALGSQAFPTDGPIDACDFSTSPTRTSNGDETWAF
ncbi:UNVERIFIED_CONTAM: hypothetical protein Slati_2475900 [Sesamum latifolium]|uniref:Uncharacterized protein n=1 Tax=Sesamum latifolium TaxID=2727402 RepID=A0AAW2WDV9_9LAMI